MTESNLPICNTLESDNGLQLPPEILNLLLIQLQQDHQFGTLSIIQELSKSHYNSVTPHMYENLYLNQRSFSRLWNDFDLMGEVIPDSIPSKTLWVNDTFQRIRRVLLLVKKITMIHSEDMESVIKASPRKVRALVRNYKQFLEPRLLANVGIITITWSIRNITSLRTFTECLDSTCEPMFICIKWTGREDGELADREYSRQWMSDFKEQKSLNLIIHSSIGEIPAIHKLNSVRLSYSDHSYLHLFDEHSPLIVQENVRTLHREFQMMDLLKASLDQLDPLKFIPFRIISSNNCGTQSEEETNLMLRDLRKTSSSIMTTKSWDEWIKTIKWIHGEDVLVEPPCEACGMPV